VICRRCVAAAAAVEPGTTEASVLIKKETSEPTVKSEKVTDKDDKQNETVTGGTVADEVTSQAELSTGKQLHRQE